MFTCLHVSRYVYMCVHLRGVSICKKGGGRDVSA